MRGKYSIIAPEAGIPLSELKTITTGTISKKGLTVYDGIKNAYGLDNKADAYTNRMSDSFRLSDAYAEELK